VRAGDGENRSTVAAIAAIRSAARHELLTPETQTAPAPSTRRNLDVDFVDKHEELSAVNLESWGPYPQGTPTRVPRWGLRHEAPRLRGSLRPAPLVAIFGELSANGLLMAVS
jgi:hypothetical protein